MQSRAHRHTTSSKFFKAFKAVGSFIYSYFFFAAIVVIKIVSGIGQVKFNQSKFYQFIKAENSPVTELLTGLAMLGSATVALFTQMPAVKRLLIKENKPVAPLAEPELKLSGKIIYHTLRPLNLISGVFKSSHLFLFSVTFLETITPLVGRALAHIFQTSYQEKESDYIKSLGTVQLTALVFFIASLCSFIAFEQKKANSNVKEIAAKVQSMIENAKFNMSKAKLMTLVALVLSTIPMPMLAYISTKGTIDAIAKILNTSVPGAVKESLSIVSGSTAAITNATCRVPCFHKLISANHHRGFYAANLSTKILLSIFLIGLSLDAAATATSNVMGAGRFFKELKMDNEYLIMLFAIVCGVATALVNASLMLETGKHNLKVNKPVSVEDVTAQPYQAIKHNDEESQTFAATAPTSGATSPYNFHRSQPRDIVSEGNSDEVYDSLVLTKSL